MAGEAAEACQVSEPAPGPGQRQSEDPAAQAVRLLRDTATKPFRLLGQRSRVLLSSCCTQFPRLMGMMGMGFLPVKMGTLMRTYLTFGGHEGFVLFLLFTAQDPGRLPARPLHWRVTVGHLSVPLLQCHPGRWENGGVLADRV